MAEQKPINPVLKQALELGPTLAFIVLYFRIKDEVYTFGDTEYSGFIVAALVFVPVLLGAMGVLWALTRTISRMQVFTAVMVIFFGGLTAWFNDERFFMMKTTLVYGTIAGLLGIGLLRGRSWLEWVMGDLMPMERQGWMIFTRRVALIFALLGIANEIVWRTQSEATWVILESFAFPAVLVVFLVAQIAMLQQYLVEPVEETNEPDPPREAER